MAALAEGRARVDEVMVPVIHQQRPNGCGAASLAMILKWHGVDVDEAELRDQLHEGERGTTMWQLKRVAETYGLHARVVRLAAPTASSMITPAVAHWDGCHFLVVEHVGETTVRVVEPVSGRVELRRSEFDRCFSGIALWCTRREEGS